MKTNAGSPLDPLKLMARYRLWVADRGLELTETKVMLSTYVEENEGEV